MFHTSRLMCVLALGAILASAQTVPAPTVETTSMVGLASGQTARLNLLNPGVLPPALGVVCTVTVTYLDGAGTVLKTGTVTVDPGKSMPFDLHSDIDLSLAANTRREIRATITVPGVLPPTPTSGTGSSTAAASICSMIPTLEIFDNITNRTEAVIGRAVTLK